ncbi:MAG: cytochrome P450 [Rhodobacteraceae bacterium]|nr:cytochrome P450 [Paracoccaceae bacterium]
MKTIDDLPVIGFSSEDYDRQPFPILADYARRWKVARSERGVELLDTRTSRKSIVNPRLGTGHPKLMEDVLGMPEGRVLEYKRNSISYHNRGETRRKLRKPVVQFLGEDGCERFRNDVRHVVRTIVEKAPADEPIDVIKAICDPIPSSVYCYWVDAPLDHAEFIARTSHTVQQVHTRNPERTADVVAAFDAMMTYIEERIAEARENPGDNLISDMIRSADAGEISESDLYVWMVKLVEANTDNTSHQIAIALIELVSRPEVWARIGKDTSLVPVAVNETMRIRPRSISTSRCAIEDVEIGGYLLPKGTSIFANIGAAHWDPEFYPEPEKFRLDRPERPAHLNFGGGMFSCLGRFTATMEVEETIALMARRFPDLRIVDFGYTHSPMFTSVTNLSVVLDGS